MLLTEQVKQISILQEIVKRVEERINIFDDRCERRHHQLDEDIGEVKEWQATCNGFRKGQDWRRQDIYILGTLGVFALSFIIYVLKGVL
jgi:hypothetical protein